VTVTARRYDEEVHVRDDVPGRVPPGAENLPPGADNPPSVFVWRGRLYVVREVLGYWRERRPWWTGPAVQVLCGREPAEAPEPRPGAQVRDGEESEDVSGEIDLTDSDLDKGLHLTLGAEQEVWRVSASRGFAGVGGIYDLCRDLCVDVSVDPEHAWRLLRVAD